MAIIGGSWGIVVKAGIGHLERGIQVHRTGDILGKPTRERKQHLCYNEGEEWLTWTSMYKCPGAKESPGHSGNHMYCSFGCLRLRGWWFMENIQASSALWLLMPWGLGGCFTSSWGLWGARQGMQLIVKDLSSCGGWTCVGKKGDWGEARHPGEWLGPALGSRGWQVETNLRNVIRIFGYLLPSLPDPPFLSYCLFGQVS